VTVIEQTTRSEVSAVTVDLYRDVHKGIRAELFDATGEAGRMDPGARTARVALAGRIHRLAEVLDAHSGHEDSVIQPAIEAHLPDLAARVQADHDGFARRTAGLVSMADDAVAAPRRTEAAAVHRLYLELAAFAGDYLAHQDLEERAVLPALEKAVGAAAVLGMHTAIISSIPPDEMARALAFMLPAMNIDDRTGLLKGIQAGAPVQVFEGVWGLSASVLSAADHAALGERLNIL
jgi:hypothetical protein